MKIVPPVCNVSIKMDYTQPVTRLCHSLLVFLQISDEDKNYGMNSYANSAGKDGSFLYGGLLDKCRSNEDYDSPLSLYNLFISWIR